MFMGIITSPGYLSSVKNFEKRNSSQKTMHFIPFFLMQVNLRKLFLLQIFHYIVD